MPKEVRAGQPVFFQRYGRGERPAVMIHCSLAHSGAWAGVASRLADRLAAAAFDLPGHGQSGDWQGGEDLLTLSARIAATFFEEQGAPMDLIGHSFGALAALRYALAAPETVRTLTLVEPVLFAAAKGFPEWEEHATESAPFADAMQAGDRETAARAFTALWGTGADWDALDPRSRAYLAERIHLITAAAPETHEDAGGLLAPGGLESLGMPVLLIAGDRSPSIVPRIAEVIAARLPDVGVASVPGAGHMAPITHPAETAGLIGVNLDRG